MTREQIPTIIIHNVEEPEVGLTVIENLMKETDCLWEAKGNSENVEDRKEAASFSKGYRFFHATNTNTMEVRVQCRSIMIIQFLNGEKSQYLVNKHMDIVLGALSDFSINEKFEPLEEDIHTVKYYDTDGNEILPEECDEDSE